MPIVFPEILVYIMVMMLTSIDFWVVKNIVGRKLVKMRWWFLIDNEGNERWHYEFRGNRFVFKDYLRHKFVILRQVGLLGYSLCHTFSMGFVLRDECPNFCHFQNSHYINLHDHSRHSVLGLQELQGSNGSPCQALKSKEE